MFIQYVIIITLLLKVNVYFSSLKNRCNNFNNRIKRMSTCYYLSHTISQSGPLTRIPTTNGGWFNCFFTDEIYKTFLDSKLRPLERGTLPLCYPAVKIFNGMQEIQWEQCSVQTDLEFNDCISLVKSNQPSRQGLSVCLSVCSEWSRVGSSADRRSVDTLPFRRYFNESSL